MFRIGVDHSVWSTRVVREGARGGSTSQSLYHTQSDCLRLQAAIRSRRKGEGVELPMCGTILAARMEHQRKSASPRGTDRFYKSQCCNDSGDRTRTCDPLINSQLLYQLSYAGFDPRAATCGA